MNPAAGQRALLKAIRRLARAVDMQSRRIERESGLTLPQIVVLGCIRDLGAVTTTAVSVEADLSPATVVAILDRLEARGLIERRRSLVDRRVVHAALTEHGAAALAAAPPPLGPGFEAAFLALPDPHRQDLIAAVLELGDLVAPRDERVREPMPRPDR